MSLADFAGLVVCWFLVAQLGRYWGAQAERRRWRRSVEDALEIERNEVMHTADWAYAAICALKKGLLRS